MKPGKVHQLLGADYTKELTMELLHFLLHIVGLRPLAFSIVMDIMIGEGGKKLMTL